MGNSTSQTANKIARTNTHDTKMDFGNLPLEESAKTERLADPPYPENVASPIVEHQKFKRKTDGNYQAMFTAAVFLNISKLLGPAQSITLLSCSKNLWNNVGSWDVLCHRLYLTEEDKEKITETVDGVDSPRAYVLFIVRTLKNLCTNCGCMWDGYLGSTHPLGFGARQLCSKCFLIPGINSVISRAQAKAMYAMKESELPSETKPQYNHNSFIMSYKVVVPVQRCRQLAMNKHGSILEIALKLYSSKIITIQRATKLLDKRGKDMMCALKASGLERFADNPLCKAFIKPKDYPHRRRCWRGGHDNSTAGVIGVLQELAFFIKHLEKNPKQKTLDVNSTMHVDDDVQFLSILIVAEKERLKVKKEVRRIVAERRARDELNGEKRGYVEDHLSEGFEDGACQMHSPDRKRKRNETSSKSCMSNSSPGGVSIDVGGGDNGEKRDGNQQQQNPPSDKQIMKKSKVCDGSPSRNNNTASDDIGNKVSQPLGMSITRYFGDLVSLVGERFGIQTRVRSDATIETQIPNTSIPSLPQSTPTPTLSATSSSSSSSSSSSVMSGGVLCDVIGKSASADEGRDMKCDSSPSNIPHATNGSSSNDKNNSSGRKPSRSYQDSGDDDHDNDSYGDTDGVSEYDRNARSSSSTNHPTQSSNLKTTVPKKRDMSIYDSDDDGDDDGDSVNSGSSKGENFHPHWVDGMPASLRSTYEILRPKSQIEKERELAAIRLRTLAKHKAAFGLAACYHPFLAALINGNEATWDSEIDADDDAASGDY